MNETQSREIEFQRRCSGFTRQHVYACQSALVDAMIQRSGAGFSDDPAEEFHLDNIENYYPQKPDRDDDLAVIRAFFQEHGLDEPDGDANPWDLGRDRMIELLMVDGVNFQFYPEISDDGLREELISAMDLGEVPGKREWVRELDQADINPPEIYEWWIVSDFLERKLKALRHPFMENCYGTWWGRCTTGQAISIDYSIRTIVRDDLVKELGWRLEDLERHKADAVIPAGESVESLDAKIDTLRREIEAIKKHVP